MPGRAVFLDRDGVINRALEKDRKPYPPTSVTQFEIFEEVPAALARLKAAGFVLVVVTNQPDVGRGTLAREVVENIHAHMLAELPIDRVEVCFHPGKGASDCDCRKPKPGMLLRAAAELGLDLARCWMVGDRWRDVDCGHAAGCRTIFIDRGYAEELRQKPDFSARHLGEAVDIILARFQNMKRTLKDLNVKIFADGADKKGMLELNANPVITGMTTNPTLMRKAGLTDFEAFARDILQSITVKPLSLEVFSDDFTEMKRQALKINGWGRNVYVKIPITNTRGESSLPLIRELAAEGVKLNVTAILTLDQVRGVAAALSPKVPAVVSVFAGRIADTGVDPMGIMVEGKRILSGLPQAELLWASVREVLNIFQANDCGCHIVTVPHDILGKALKMAGMDLGELSLDTVKMFANDAKAAGFSL
ncbi:MAG TPA: transaldolase [Candidatus Acidoferrales bacterium]|nr:transaldolase [Candidatus Acidoferrales bacterium]